MPDLYRRHFWILSLCLLSASCAVGSSKKEAPIAGLMVERLSWMDDVARIKKARGLPVTDPDREATLLQAMTTRGVEAGLPAAAVRGFFSGQMAAARQYQQEWLADPNRSAEDAESSPDLATTIRPALDQLGNDMILAIREARQSGDQQVIISDARHRLTKAGYSKEVIALAMNGLMNALSR